jgi:uncharacterized protein (DUF1697 family)
MAHNASLRARQGQEAFFEAKLQAKTEKDFEAKVRPFVRETRCLDAIPIRSPRRAAASRRTSL